MSGYLSQSSLQINKLEAAVRARSTAKLNLIDLTVTNPTQCGLLFPNEILLTSSAKYFAARRYRPDPKGLLQARESIATYYQQRTPPLTISPEQIILTASTSESYSLLFSLLCEPGDHIYAPKPSYPLFEYLASHHRIHLKQYELNSSDAWKIDEATVPDQADTAKAILVVSPHNPCGVIHDTHVKQLGAHIAPLIADEVFSEFCYGKPSTPPLATLYPDKPVFHLNGISKMFALPDLKLGWIAMNEAAYTIYGERLELLNDTFLSGNTLAQAMLPDIFLHAAPFVSEMTGRIKKNTGKAMELLLSSGQIVLPPPDGGYVVFPEAPHATDDEALAIKLVDAGVLVHPGYYYDMDSGVHLMISCLCDEASLKEGIGRILTVLQSQ